jgi:hypothetical protein
VVISEKLTVTNDKETELTGNVVIGGTLNISDNVTMSGDVTISGGKINFSEVSADNQTGIYARFA